jgi:GxxExxY protein
MELTQRIVNDLTYKVIGCAIEVHKILGPGLTERVYEKCFLKELSLQSLNVERQVNVPVYYKGFILQGVMRLDIIVESILIVELKAVEQFHPVHEAQLITYMKLMKKPKGILINFNCTNIFKYGQRTFVNELFSGLKEK